MSPNLNTNYDTTIRRFRDIKSVEFDDKANADLACQTIRDLFGVKVPNDLEEFYFTKVVQFFTHEVIYPGRRVNGQSTTDILLGVLASFKSQHAIPFAGDGFGNYFAISYSVFNGEGGIYFFEHENNYERPMWAAASKIDKFLEFAIVEDSLGGVWPSEPSFIERTDPELKLCKRAPPLWLTD